MTKIQVETCQGPQLPAAIPALARLRITVFREFPYLYDGDEAYERDYLQIYLNCPEAAVILARAGSEIVGASTCLPLRAEAEAIRVPFDATGIDLDAIFYFGESVLLPAARGQGIGVRFFEARERVARAAAAAFAVFCAVRRPPDHPARPANVPDMPHFWRRRGFAPLPGVSCQMTWKELDGPAPLVHDLDFWIKPLSTRPVPDLVAAAK